VKSIGSQWRENSVCCPGGSPSAELLRQRTALECRRIPGVPPIFLPGPKGRRTITLDFCGVSVFVPVCGYGIFLIMGLFPKMG
jgi:hypothetical protein